MRLSCPQCHTEYDVPDAALTGRARTLRCADCGTKWKVPAVEAVAVAEVLPELPTEEIAPEPEAAPVAVFVAVPEDIEPAMADTAPAETVEAVTILEPAVLLSATRDSPASPKPAQPKPNRGLGISILLVLLVIAVVLAEHRVIAQAWPPSLRLFNALGLR